MGFQRHLPNSWFGKNRLWVLCFHYHERCRISCRTHSPRPTSLQNIIATFLPRDRMHVRAGIDYDTFIRQETSRGSGWCIVGLDRHVAFLVIEPSGNIRFIHASPGPSKLSSMKPRSRQIFSVAHGIESRVTSLPISNASTGGSLENSGKPKQDVNPSPHLIGIYQIGDYSSLLMRYYHATKSWPNPKVKRATPPLSPSYQDSNTLRLLLYTWGVGISNASAGKELLFRQVLLIRKTMHS